MNVRVTVSPALLAWARERSGREADYLEHRFPKLHLWETGEVSPTLLQLEAFARATYTPIGYFFLQDPPADRLPIPDFRTVTGTELRRPSPHLLDTIALCEERQNWYREYLNTIGEEPLTFVGTMNTTMAVQDAAEQIRSILGFGVEERSRLASWTDALSKLAENAESAGVLVMISGVVGSNTHRKLDPKEFRGFALTDRFAPLVFVNGSDTKAAQIFTLTHELVHIWLDQSGISDTALDVRHSGSGSAATIERWCNAVAAEFLVPLQALEQDLQPSRDLGLDLKRLSRRYKVSSLVILRRFLDAGHLTRDQFRTAYDHELARALNMSRDSGGNFLNAQPVRVSKTFARAVITDTLVGQTLYRDAFRLLGFRTQSAFDGLGRSLGVV